MKQVYKLQNQLVKSFEGRAIAVRRVVRSSGGNTPGIHKGEPVELHHIKPFKEEGKYTMASNEPLHRICHQNVTDGYATANENVE